MATVTIIAMKIKPPLLSEYLMFGFVMTNIIYCTTAM